MVMQAEKKRNEDGELNEKVIWTEKDARRKIRQRKLRRML